MAKLDADAVWDFAKAIRQTMPSESQKRQATVQSVDDDGTVWVQVAGSEGVTPIATSNANVQPGDVVNVEQRGASLHVEGNITDPSVGERGVERVVAPVRASLSKAAEDADAAKLAAIAAQEAAEAASAANQHFWDDSNGAHVTEYEKDEWTDPTSGSYHAGHNMLLNSLGLLFRKAMNNLASFTQSAVAFFDGLGNEASNVVASFGADGFQAGRAGESHMVGDYHSFKLVDKDLSTYLHVSDLRDETGYYEVGEVFEATTSNSYLLQYYCDSVTMVVVDGVGIDSDGYSFNNWGIRGHAMVGQLSLVLPPQAGAQIVCTYLTSSPMAKGLTFGNRRAYQGGDTTTIGAMSAVLGEDDEASGYVAFASGWSNAATGDASTAEGRLVEASGDYSHAQNYGTKAAGASQTAMGRFNTEDTSDTYAVIVGNGTSDSARSNAYTLDWDGNGEYAGEVTAHAGTVAHNLTDKADAADLADLAAVVGNLGTTTVKDISTAVSSSTSTWTSVGSIALTEGTWVIIGGLQFVSNATGYRYISLNDSNGTPAAAWTRATRNSVTAISGNATVLHTSHILTVTASGRTVHLMGWQNSGGNVNLTGSLRAVRVG